MMQLEEADTPLLKEWMIQRLQNISDADSDVLADYCLALVKSDDPEDQIRQSCLENLGDFTKDHTAPFVDDLINAIKTKSYDPSRKVAAAPSSTFTGANYALPVEPNVASNAPSHLNGAAANFQPGEKRKRSFSSRDDAGGAPHMRNGTAGGDRPMKQAKRGRGNATHQRGGRQQQQNPLNMPGGLPQGFPPFDPSNPMGAIMAMQAMGFPMPGMPPLPETGFPEATGSSGGARPDSRGRKKGQRCRDYDTKGFCARGASCPYEHGSDRIVVPGASEEYDPNNSMMLPNPSASGTIQQDHRATQRGGFNTRGRGQRGGRGGTGASHRGGRASFSSAAPNNDRSITGIVVEQIPEDKFNEDDVRGFFSEFGDIANVDLQPYKRLAVVTYTDYDSARKAYDSPKVIFDNRFVKVYWHKPDKTANGGGHTFGRPQEQKQQEDEEMLDPEEVAKRQAEAQASYEERMKKLKEAEEQKEELNRKIQAQAEQRKKLMEKLAAKTGNAAPTDPPSATEQASNDTMNAVAALDGAREGNQNSQTDSLRARLAALEAEASSLGIPIDESAQAQRGAFRGRGVPRGGSRGAFRGAWRGRGGTGGWRGGAFGMSSVQRLDNRPKSVAVTAADEGVDIKQGSKEEENLKSFLVTIGDFAALTSPQPADDKTKVVAFHHRYLAESLLQSVQKSADSIPGIGKVTLKWVRNEELPEAAKEALKAASAQQAPTQPPQPPQPSIFTAGNGATSTSIEAKAQQPRVDKEGDAAMSGAAAEEEGVGQMEEHHAHDDRDYDVADFDADEDRWA